MNPVAFKRIPKEIEAARDLSGVGIYYISDTDSFLRGHAMIFGPENTPYANCPLFFRFLFPNDYPFSPPRVEFLTSDGRTRFHPNLYVCGKVCLSILGTFPGPSWQSTMSLSMVLVSLQALLDENPLRNEPGYAKVKLDQPVAKEFRDLVEYRIVGHTLLQEYKHKLHMKVFEEECAAELHLRLDKLKAFVKQKCEEEPVAYMNCPYGMSGKVDWKLLDRDSNGKETEESRI